MKNKFWVEALGFRVSHSADLMRGEGCNNFMFGLCCCFWISKVCDAVTHKTLAVTVSVEPALEGGTASTPDRPRFDVVDSNPDHCKGGC